MKKRTWNEVLDALEETHTLSIRDVCMILKCDRSWANRYILPHCDKIYLNSNIRDDMPNGMNWITFAAIVLQKDMKESVWVSSDDFLKLITSSITSVTVQTKRIPKESLVQNREQYIAKYKALTDEKNMIISKGNVNPLTLVAFIEKMNTHFFNSLSEIGRTLIDKQVKVTERGKVQRVPVHLDDMMLNNWIAPHDVKQYGDTDEKIYRKFFRAGYIRIELSVTDKDGYASKKVYYLPDPEPLVSEINEYITVSYSDYIQYFHNII